jgi:hypothetical protein
MLTSICARVSRVPSAGTPWVLANFAEALDLWLERDQPIPGIVMNVGEWIMTRSDDPYQGVRREAGFPNLWRTAVPSSQRDGTAVYCAYWIKERDRMVVCENIATLHLPIA